MNLVKLENKSIIEELVPVYTTDKDIKVVNARELYQTLGVRKDFSSWIKSNLKNYNIVDFCEDDTITQDGESEYDAIKITIPATQGKGKKIEYILTLDTAKEIAMMSRCDNGRAIRKYFIEVEKTYNQMVETLSDTEKTPEQKIAEALVLAQGVLDKTKHDLLKANRNKNYNKKINTQLRRKVRQLESELELAKSRPVVNSEEIQAIQYKLNKAEEQANYWEGAYTHLEEKLEVKESQLMSLLTVRKDGKKYFNLLSAKHAKAILDRDENKKSMKANVFRKESILACKKVQYSHSFAANFIEKIHPTSIPTALGAYFTALKNRLEDKFESVIGENLIKEVTDFLSESQDSIDAVVEEINQI